MRKHKRLIIVGLILALLLVLAASYFRIQRKPKISSVGDNFKPTVLEYNPGSNITDFDLVKTKITSESWTEAAALAVKYGDNTKNSKTLRVSAYGYCVFAAQKLNTEAQGAQCRQKGEALVKTFATKDEQDINLKVFEANAIGQAYKEPERVMTEGSRE